MNLKNLYYKLPTTGNSFQIIYDAYRILFNYIGLYVSSFLCVGVLCGFLFLWFRPKGRLCRSAKSVALYLFWLRLKAGLCESVSTGLAFVTAENAEFAELFDSTLRPKRCLTHERGSIIMPGVAVVEHWVLSGVFLHLLMEYICWPV